MAPAYERRAVSWRAVVTALDDGARFRSHVSPYVHPLAGRPLLWHAVVAALAVQPAPSAVHVLHRADTPLALPDLGDAVTLVSVAPGGETDAVERATPARGTTLVVDGGAALLTASTLERVLAAAEQGGAATLQASGTGRALARARRGRASADDAETIVAPPVEGVLVDDRHALARAGVVVRDRLVRQHEDAGVSFLLPDSVWVDVGVRIGVDTIVYPGVVMEGATTVGAECVIGPYSRLVDAVVGRGVELGGWNHLVRSTVRNHAVLEAYARRGVE